MLIGSVYSIGAMKKGISFVRFVIRYVYILDFTWLYQVLGIIYAFDVDIILEEVRLCPLFGIRAVLDKHDSPQWYDIVHFEHKLSWLCFGLPQKASYQWS